MLDTIPDYDDNFTIDTLLQKILTSDKSYDSSKIVTAYEFAAEAHKGQKRTSGQDYIIHPLNVAYFLLELEMDTDTICAALLHDVVEDTPVTLKEVQKRFGQGVASLVDGVTKLEKIPNFNRDEQNAEDIRKILLAMSEDIRVMIIKLCDRLHNMRTLKCRPYVKQLETSYDTLELYAPIARRLGIRSLKDELEDLAFHYLEPYAYAEIEALMDRNKEQREQFIESIQKRIADRLEKEHFEKPPQISGRVKSIYGIYNKCYKKHLSFDEIYDKYAVRVIVTTVQECFCVLGIIHEMFIPLPNRIKDYISTPKQNAYQSLHTTVLGREGIPFEVQIRTWEMHADAEYGVAAHWKYKDGILKNDQMEKRLAWVRQILEAQKSSDDVEEIVRLIKEDVASEDIVVLSPKGRSYSLPIGSTPIDFAYKVHTDVGHQAVAAKANGKLVPLDYQLQTGEICEIITSKDPGKGPNRAWKDFVKTSKAKDKIRIWFKKERREENIMYGKVALEREFRRYRIHVPDSELAAFLSDDFKRHNCSNLEDFYASIGYGGILLSKIMPRLKEKYHRLYSAEESEQPKPVVQPKASSRKNNIILDKIDDCVVKFAQCCNPLPGDEIVGFITRGHGISVHTTKCTNYNAMLNRNNPEELERWCEIQWSENSVAQLQTSMEVIATDRVGLVFDITAILTEARIPIVHSSSRNLKNGNALFEATITIASTEQLNNLFDKLRKIKGVISVERSSI
ncbi:MAG: bifunctional (p)ppGpp synthetase/guanosine-3',5'-bis(diphosphate) 3'-pyrophosphohydrolase [Ruminococcus sp.]|nr:bifunctional (p)ppGpp synthetase/guanosine-3',5'-bis(diphosphate) 3'-pyrophosphohydrolase [Ruminococcus sp.]